MKVLLTGANGQLGQELQNTVPESIQIVSKSSQELDITDAKEIERGFDAVKPDVVVNCAAYTAVDRAEEDKEKAFAVNGLGPGLMAQATSHINAKLIHISTDFIFDGRKSSPYLPEGAPKPLSLYGESKLEGERQVQTILGGAAAIFRTSWVYSQYSNNFVLTMLRLMQERDQLSIVADQVGTPTWARSLARAIWKGIDLNVSGIHHWTDAGVASWYDFAVAIQEEALQLGLLTKEIMITPIRTVDYPTPAKRPSYSVLDKTSTWQALGFVADHWRVSLRKMLLGVRGEA